MTGWTLAKPVMGLFEPLCASRGRGDAPLAELARIGRTARFIDLSVPAAAISCLVRQGYAFVAPSMTLRRRFAAFPQALTCEVVSLTCRPRNLFAARAFRQLARARRRAFALDHATYGKGAVLTRRQLRSDKIESVRWPEPDKP